MRRTNPAAVGGNEKDTEKGRGGVGGEQAVVPGGHGFFFALFLRSLDTMASIVSAGKKLQPVVAQLPACEKGQSLPGQLQDQIGIESALPLQIVQSATGKSTALSSLGRSSYNAKEYQLYPPSKEELRRKLKEWVREVGDE